jgi:hypothetical protein
MEEMLQRISENLIGRFDGPLHFRIIVQPLMAVIFAIYDGVKDARDHQPAYFWGMLVNPDHRKTLLKDGWKHFGKIFILAIILDVVYQIEVQHTVYPGEVVIVALFLAVVPYVLLRGPVNRLVRRFGK